MIDNQAESVQACDQILKLAIENYQHFSALSGKGYQALESEWYEIAFLYGRLATAALNTRREITGYWAKKNGEKDLDAMLEGLLKPEAVAE